MESLKPGLLDYLKVQNNIHYKMTGVMEDKAGIYYAEKNYAKRKCIIDLVLLVLYLTALIFGFSLIYSICISAFSQIESNHTAYDPNIGSKYFLTMMPIYIGTLLFQSYIVPALMKVLRILFGFRRFFMKFDKTEKREQIGSSFSGKIEYLEFYNNRIAFNCDSFFYNDSKKIKKLKIEYFKKNGVENSGRILAHIYQSIVFALPFCIVLKLLNVPAIEIFLYVGLISLYLLSHLLAFFSWKRYFNKHLT